MTTSVATKLTRPRPTPTHWVPIATPTRVRIGARALALTGVVGLSAVAMAVGSDPNTITQTTTISYY